MTVTNTGGTSATVSAATASGSGFSMTGPVLPMTGQSVVFTATFKPASAGAAAGSIVVTSNAANASLSAALTGTGATPGALGVTPTTLTFGNVPVATKQSQNGTLTNTGGASITVSQATVNGTGYSVSGLNLPVTLAAGQTAGFMVTFSAQAAGNFPGSVAFSGSAPTATITLAGSGLASGSLGANPASVNYGTVQLGRPKRKLSL